MPIYTVNIRVLHFTQNYNREKVLQFLCGMRVLFLNLLTVTGELLLHAIAKTAFSVVSSFLRTMLMTMNTLFTETS